MNKFQVVELTDKNDACLNTISGWMYNWDKEEGWNIDKIKCYVKNCISKNIPRTIIVVTGNKIIGVCNLLMHDLDSRPDIYPWLGNLFVDENYRNQGVSRLLINEAIKQAKKLDLKELYLYTTHRFI